MITMTDTKSKSYKHMNYNKSILSLFVFFIGMVGMYAQPVSTVKYETMIEIAEESADKKDYANAIEWFNKVLQTQFRRVASHF